MTYTKTHKILILLYTNTSPATLFLNICVLLSLQLLSVNFIQRSGYDQKIVAKWLNLSTVLQSKLRVEKENSTQQRKRKAKAFHWIQDQLGGKSVTVKLLKNPNS